MSVDPRADSAATLLAQAAAVRAQLTGPGAPFELETVTVQGRAVRAYKNAFPSLAALIDAGRAHGAQEFMAYEGDRWTFDRFYAAVDALAGRLQSELGIQPGERVAIAMRNRPEWVVSFAALALVGAVPAPLNSFGQRDELVPNLRDLQPRWLFCDAERQARVREDLGALQCQSVVVDETGDGALTWSRLTGPGGPRATTPARAPEDPALILFTSGTSSQAKGVLSSQRAVCQALHNIDFIGAVSAMTSPAALAAMRARGLAPTTLTVVPLFHVSGLHAQLLSSLRHGRRLVFMYRWDPARALELIRSERITQFNGAPAMVAQLMATPGFDDPALTGSIGGIGFGGAGLPKGLIGEVLARRKDSMSGIGFGMTETNGVGAAVSGALFELRPQASGLLSPIVEVRVRDADGQDAPAATPGELCLRGVSLMQGYWGGGGVAASVLEDGWLRTGDVGYIDADGYLHVVDRLKDVINRSGEKIAAAEVESCMLQQPGVAEAAVFAQPDESTGEAVVAVVVLRPGAAIDADSVRSHVAAHLASYKVPAVVHVRGEPLPRTPVGKVLKNSLKREYVASAK